MRTFDLSAIGCVLLLSGAAACAHHEPPKELTAARDAYQRASTGMASTKAPVELHEAKKSLERAEREFKDDPEGQTVRDYAYIAQREALLATVRGNIQVAKEAKTIAQQSRQQQTREQLAQTREQLEKSQQSAQSVAAQLEAERRAREEAERLASERQKEMEDALAKVAEVKKDERGTVISLPGGVLFGSGKSTLLPGARSRLDRVAKALMTNNQAISIEGHTDSTGSAELNQRLSEQRAENVREYLISQGLPADRVKSVGYGASRPVADNSTPAGRAQNRRVEVIVSDEPTT